MEPLEEACAFGGSRGGGAFWASPLFPGGRGGGVDIGAPPRGALVEDRGVERVRTERYRLYGDDSHSNRGRSPALVPPLRQPFLPYARFHHQQRLRK